MNCNTDVKKIILFSEMFITIKIIVRINVIVVFIKAHIYVAFANSQVNSLVIRVLKLHKFCYSNGTRSNQL